jgi:preprotein translocase subunit SecE
MRAVKEVSAAFPEDEPSRGQKVLGYPARVRQFLHDVRLEMRNVTWPTSKDVQATTLVVLVATFFFGFYLGMVLDVPLARLMTWLLRAGRGLLG